jgi:L-aminopeptidase/D-esterase-like protein
MQCLGFKGGIGTASRRLSERGGGFTVGVLVQCNFGLRRQLRIAGVPVGDEIPSRCSATTLKGHSGQTLPKCVALMAGKQSASRDPSL